MLAILCKNWFLFCSWTATPKHLGVIYTDTSNWRVLFTISTYHFYNVGQRQTESWLSLSYNIFSRTKLLCSSNNIIFFYFFLILACWSKTITFLLILQFVRASLQFYIVGKREASPQNNFFFWKLPFLFNQIWTFLLWPSSHMAENTK